MKTILLFLLFLQFTGNPIFNDTENKYLIKAGPESVYLPPSSSVMSSDSLVFIQKLEDNGLVTSLGWAIVKSDMSRAEYLTACVINKTEDTLLIAQNRISFIINPQQKTCFDELFVDYNRLVELEINVIKNGEVLRPLFQIIEASLGLEIIIAP